MKNWWDNRSNKVNKYLIKKNETLIFNYCAVNYFFCQLVTYSFNPHSLKPSHLDFKHKDTGEILWIGRATPQWHWQNYRLKMRKQKLQAHDAVPILMFGINLSKQPCYSDAAVYKLCW
jgi:hypothetical protein